MARGVTQDQVTRAADALLARGERPTIERVRAQLGTGSPNTLLRLIDVWWADLAKRLAGETRLPDLPSEVASAFKAAWAVASEQATATAERSLVEARQGVEHDRDSLAAERLRWSADLASAKDAQTVAERRFADHQHLVEHLQAELRDLKAERDKLQEQANILVKDMMRLGAKLEKQQNDRAAERASTTAHVRGVEDRAHAEVDRARAEIKGLRNALVQAERASQMARDTAAREHKEHVGQLRSAEQEAAAQRARADALENQLERQGTLMRSLSPVTRRSGTKKKINTVDPLAELREDFEALVARMQTPEHKAGVDALFAATGKEIGANAQTYARTANAPPRAKKNIRNRRGSVN